MEMRAFAAQEFIISGICNSIKHEFLEPRGYHHKYWRIGAGTVLVVLVVTVKCIVAMINEDLVVVPVLLMMCGSVNASDCSRSANKQE
jgi:hypothetical protein